MARSPGRGYRLNPWRMTLVGLGATLGTLASAAAASQTPQNPTLEIGVVQRFGDDPAATLVLEPLSPTDELSLKFQTGGAPESLTTDRLVLETNARPLSEPALQERVVLSTHRSFESAEDSAQQWRRRGIETEIAQPGEWQVWAKRDVYSTPLLRRLLLDNLQGAGYDSVFLDTQVAQSVPQAAFVANGYRYNRDRVTIESDRDRIRVIRKQGDERQSVRLYGGDMALQPNAYGTYTLVNQVPIETYLRGVVPYEIGLAAPPTTIEAQAILARTYALRNLRRFAIDQYQLCADTQCQVYRGLSGAAAVTDQAIAATRGQVVTYQDELIDALYSSNTGGVTAAFSDVWNGPDRPYLQPVIDSVRAIWDLGRRPLDQRDNLKAFLALEQGFNEEEWDTFRWQEDSDLTEITQDLKAYLQAQQHPLAHFNQVQRLQVTERAPSGRVQTLVVGTDIGTVTLEKDEVIRALSAPLSLLFYLEGLYQQPADAAAPDANPTLTGYRFIGGGYGHGVGMSQTGAYHLGDMGWSSDRILQFYYPGTEIQPIHDDLTFWRPPTEAAPR